jgi:hypothetical protein
MTMTDKTIADLIVEHGPVGADDDHPLQTEVVTAAEFNALRDELIEGRRFRDKLAALAAIEVYIGESGANAARNIRDLLAGAGSDDNDPRVQARRWDLEW